jgi:D-lactate dehydrogenase
VGVAAADVVQRVTSPHLLGLLTDAIRSAVSKDLVPTVAGPMPHAAPAELPRTKREGAAAAYFPACINRIFGRDNSKAASPALPEALVTLSARAGQPLWIPEDVRGLCCSTPWSSKGYKRGQAWISEQMCDALLRWSDGGKLPVVVDAASCTLGLMDDLLEHLDDERKDRSKKVRILDSIEWCKSLLPALHITKTIPEIIVHPTCSTTHLGLNASLLEIARELADHALIPFRNDLLRDCRRSRPAPSRAGPFRDPGHADPNPERERGYLLCLRQPDVRARHAPNDRKGL